MISLDVIQRRKGKAFQAFENGDVRKTVQLIERCSVEMDWLEWSYAVLDGAKRRYLSGPGRETGWLSRFVTRCAIPAP